MICITYNVRGGKALPCTPDELHRARSLSSVVDTSDRLKEITDEMAWIDKTSATYDELDKEKKKLKLERPAILPHASSFDDYERKNSKAHPSGLVLFDIDHYQGDINDFYESKIKDNVTAWNIAEVEISAGGDGLHIIFVKPQGLTISQAQQMMADNLDVEFDEGTFDLARACFCVPESYVLYQNDDLLFRDPASLPELRSSLSPSATLGEAFDSGQNAEQNTPSNGDSSENESCEQGNSLPLPLGGGGKGGEASSYGLTAFDLCLSEAGLSTSEIDVPGERNWHNTLKAILSVGLCQLLSQGQLLAVVKARMPNYYETDDCKRLIQDFYKNYTDDNGRMSMTLRKIYAQAVKAGNSDDEDSDSTEIDDESSGCPRMPKKLPPLIAHLVSNVPAMYKSAVANAVFPSLAAHLHGVTFRYIDNQQFEAGMSCLLVADAGIGKGSVNAPIGNIIRDFLEHDEMDRMREQQWKENYQKCSDKDHRPIRPADIYIQVPESDMTSAALILFLKDLENNGERCLYQKMDEVEMLGRIRTNGSVDTDRLICLGYDRSKYGAERASANSISGNPALRWNWNASTTPSGALKFLRKSLTNGTLSRLNLCTIFKPKVERDKNGKRKRSLPVFGTYDNEFYETLKPYIDNLNAANGLIESPEVNKLANDVIDNCEDVLDEMNNDPVYDNLWHRACVIGFRKAMTLYIASGYQWTNEMSEFIKWSVEYDLWVKMYFFHELMRQELLNEQMMKNANIMDQRNSTKSLYAQLPDEFSTQELVDLRVKNYQSSNVRMIISRWRKCCWIEPAGSKLWRKTVTGNFDARQ